ncbi:juvenile hormone acid O-methyltransferase-like [Ixodes scapularis]|uniref:juvenile hormone acid O-methyltransferase-like n=1 Tax=Ixodes scapularis TaxID=6945 RepID=UPI001AD7DB85|nr:juvenile hormone acid O-methyltransferase-like [Ixodes scapularis]
MLRGFRSNRVASQLKQLQQAINGSSRSQLIRDSSNSGVFSTGPRLEPELYVAANALQRRDNIHVLDLLNTAFRRPPGEYQQFLDIGCAIGDFTREVLMPRCFPCRRLVGTDASATMIDYARRHFDHSHITYETLNIAHDVSRFLQTHGTFDRVYSFYCLHWIKDQRTAFANIARLLAPDGECLLQFCARTPVYALWREFARMDRWRSHITNIEDYIPPSQDEEDLRFYLEKLIYDANLKQHTCEVRRNVWTFPSEEHLTSSLSSVLPVAGDAAAEEKQELYSAMSAEMLRRCERGPEGFSAEFDVYVVHASKPSSTP